ncbi:MAG: deoxyribose-phosphate aldolase [Acidimicrobiales bacterium]|nr:deoxyribose-phosphate aldolase [Acidimicrobiales bacterium]
MERAQLARMVDLTLLSPTATPGQIAMLCGEAVALDVAAICISPSQLPLPAAALPPQIAVCTVVGFPSGAHRSCIKAAEAAQAVQDGATEIDMVIDLGAATAGRWDLVTKDIEAVRQAVPSPTVLKVIIESGALRDDEAIIKACEAAEHAGADFVKTSTGFHPDGGATLHAVSVMARAVGGRLGVKAAGGIADTQSAQAMIQAGATRIGCSNGRAIIEGLEHSG